jgi:hypothetical protein
MIVEMSLVSLQLLLWYSPLALPKLISHGLAQQLLVWHATVKLKLLQLQAIQQQQLLLQL